MNSNITKTREYNILSPTANIDANYGPWSSTTEYESWLKNDYKDYVLTDAHIN